jgi:hypothetical protein
MNYYYLFIPTSLLFISEIIPFCSVKYSGIIHFIYRNIVKSTNNTKPLFVILENEIENQV